VDAQGKAREEVKTFGTMTRDLLALSDWLAERKVTHVAMESTGVFWKPIFNILDGRFHVWLVNAKHIKQVPGRKTDVKDCQWIAQLLQHGLLRPSFVPDRSQRELRDLTRHRAQLTAEHTRIANRIHKVLEDANIKLGSVATDILGKSGRRIIQALVQGNEDPKALAAMALGRLRKKTADLEVALEGHVTEHHRFMLRMLWKHLEELEALIREVEARIEEKMRPFEEPVHRLADIPGVQQQAAHAALAEMGLDMSQFPTADHLCSWAGFSPGNNESAGKRKSGKTTKGNRWLRSVMVQVAWAASRTKGTYFRALYQQIARRRGKKRAIVAVARAILVTMYHMLERGSSYQDLGDDHFHRLNPERVRAYYVKRLEAMGYKVSLKEADDAA
jgi:transposase